MAARKRIPLPPFLSGEVGLARMGLQFFSFPPKASFSVNILEEGGDANELNPGDLLQGDGVSSITQGDGSFILLP